MLSYVSMMQLVGIPLMSCGSCWQTEATPLHPNIVTLASEVGIAAQIGVLFFVDLRGSCGVSRTRVGRTRSDLLEQCPASCHRRRLCPRLGYALVIDARCEIRETAAELPVPARVRG